MSEEKTQSIKVTLIGDTGVGKTCIIKRYTENEYDPQVKSTIGASYSQKILEINDKTIALDVWDTAGQEQYRALGRHFYKNAYIVCLVYDITNLKSFDSLKDWYEDLKTHGEKCRVIAIVGNKSDCYENEEVKEEDARKYAKEINASFFLVSAKTADNIELLFTSLTKEFLGPEFSKKLKEEKDEKGVGETKKIKASKDNNNKNKKKKCC